MITTTTTFHVPNDNDDHNNLNDNDDPLTTNIKGLLAYNIGKRHKSTTSPEKLLQLSFFK